MKKKIGVFIPATLGMLTAFGPFVTDFYLPVLPEMSVFFHTSPALASLSLTSGMLGLAVGQVFIGPLTDKYGRKKILVGSMLMFAIASILCIISPNIYIFNLMRLFQGLAGAGGIVISKSMSTDMFSGKELANFMAILGSINGIAPVCAPVVGGLMAGVTNWQGVFGLLLGIGIILMGCSMRLPETLTPEHRLQKSIMQVYANLFRVFRNRLFSLSTLAEMACFFTFFAYISSSPFILQQVYGLSPFHFSLCFALNALTIGIGAGIGPQFKHTNTALKCGAIDMMIAAVCLSFCLFVHAHLVVVMGFYIYMMISFGLMQPGLTATALDAERQNAGAASAIFGASGFVAGAISSPIVGIGKVEITSSIVMLSGALICLLLTLPLCKTLKMQGMKKDLRH
ncbi:MAG TPA: Bcr/CflA family drug resistance efflux transporter [Prevotella sp.]|nr:multidrug effflux MFS transporter [uncultured Prevotella sp.]HBF06118.1 Bcr/CflA family drug resistance efflux transporter [Candidatus Segatella violae]